jgi:hypothetical protein
MRHWKETDRAERERVASVLRTLAAELGGDFVGPRDVMGVTDDGEEYGPVPDYGTASVTSQGLAVEVGVQVPGGPNAKSLRIGLPPPPGRTWTVDRLHARAYRRRSRGDPHEPRTFLGSYRSADPERLGPEARAALLDLLRHATDVRLDAGGLTVWALPARRRTDARIDGVTGTAALAPHVHRVAAVARLLLGA